MRTFILKTKKIKIWVSGSQIKPYTHIYISSKKTKHGFKGLNIFLHKGKFSNELPNWLQRSISLYKSWEYFKETNFNIDEETGKVYRDVSFIQSTLLFYIINNILIERKQRKCNHEFEVESNISGENGCEYYYCKKCGFSQDITWY